MTDGFTWRDGERTIRFGRGAIAEAVEALGGAGYALLTTERAAGDGAGGGRGAAGVHMLGDGYVDELAGELLGAVARERVVGARRRARGRHREGAGGGLGRDAGGDGGADDAVGRRDDADPPARRGRRPAAPTVRPRVVVNDPALSASQPLAELAASALNALSHAAEGPCTPLAEPGGDARRPRRGAAAGALARARRPTATASRSARCCAATCIDSTGYGLHHVLAQTLVRLAGAGTGPPTR